MTYHRRRRELLAQYRDVAAARLQVLNRDLVSGRVDEAEYWRVHDRVLHRRLENEFFAEINAQIKDAEAVDRRFSVSPQYHAGFFALLVLIIATFSSFWTLSPVGYIAYTPGRPQQLELNLTTTQGAQLPLGLEELSSLRVSGRIIGPGSVKIVAVIGGQERLVYSSSLSDPAALTGLVVAQAELAEDDVPAEPPPDENLPGPGQATDPINETAANESEVQANASLDNFGNESQNASENASLSTSDNATEPPPNLTQENATQANLTGNLTVNPENLTENLTDANLTPNVSVPPNATGEPQVNVTPNLTRPGRPFSNQCVETCALDNASNVSIGIQVEDAVLLLDSVEYTVLVPNYPPSFYDAIFNFSFLENHTIDLRKHFADLDDDPLVYELNDTSNLTMDVVDDVAFFTARRAGVFDVVITASDGKAGTDSNEFRIFALPSLDEAPLVLPNQTNLSNTTVEAAEEDVIQGAARVGEPVVWTKRIRIRNPAPYPQQENLTFTVHRFGTDLRVRDVARDERVSAAKLNRLRREHALGREFDFITNAEEDAFRFEETLNPGEEREYEVTYTTDPPIQVVTELSPTRKIITVSAEYHYENVQAATTIPNSLPSAVRLYRLVEGTRSEFPAEKLDTDGDGRTDLLEWIVPRLSTETFEVEIIVLNIVSQPSVDGTWNVDFQTQGTADLEVTPANGTTYGAGVPYDLSFIELRCDGEGRPPAQTLPTILYPNWTCAGTGHLAMKEWTGYQHFQEFRFGSQTAWAMSLGLESLPPIGVVLNSTSSVLYNPVKIYEYSEPCAQYIRNPPQTFATLRYGVGRLTGGGFNARYPEPRDCVRLSGTDNATYAYVAANFSSGPMGVEMTKNGSLSLEAVNLTERMTMRLRAAAAEHRWLVVAHDAIDMGLDGDEDDVALFVPANMSLPLPCSRMRSSGMLEVNLSCMEGQSDPLRFNGSNLYSQRFILADRSRAPEGIHFALVNLTTEWFYEVTPMRGIIAAVKMPSLSAGAVYEAAWSWVDACIVGDCSFNTWTTNPSTIYGIPNGSSASSTCAYSCTAGAPGECDITSGCRITFERNTGSWATVATSTDGTTTDPFDCNGVSCAKSNANCGDATSGSATADFRPRRTNSSAASVSIRCATDFPGSTASSSASYFLYSPGNPNVTNNMTVYDAGGTQNGSNATERYLGNKTCFKWFGQSDGNLTNASLWGNFTSNGSNSTTFRLIHTNATVVHNDTNTACVNVTDPGNFSWFGCVSNNYSATADDLRLGCATAWVRGDPSTSTHEGKRYDFNASWKPSDPCDVSGGWVVSNGTNCSGKVISVVNISVTRSSVLNLNNVTLYITGNDTGNYSIIWGTLNATNSWILGRGNVTVTGNLTLQNTTFQLNQTADAQMVGLNISSNATFNVTDSNVSNGQNATSGWWLDVDQFANLSIRNSYLGDLGVSTASNNRFTSLYVKTYFWRILNTTIETRRDEQHGVQCDSRTNNYDDVRALFANNTVTVKGNSTYGFHGVACRYLQIKENTFNNTKAGYGIYTNTDLLFINVTDNTFACQSECISKNAGYDDQYVNNTFFPNTTSAIYVGGSNPNCLIDRLRVNTSTYTAAQSMILTTCIGMNVTNFSIDAAASGGWGLELGRNASVRRGKLNLSGGSCYRDIDPSSLVMDVDILDCDYVFGSWYHASRRPYNTTFINATGTNISYAISTFPHIYIVVKHYVTINTSNVYGDLIAATVGYSDNDNSSFNESQTEASNTRLKFNLTEVVINGSASPGSNACEGGACNWTYSTPYWINASRTGYDNLSVELNMTYNYIQNFTFKNATDTCAPNANATLFITNATNCTNVNITVREVNVTPTGTFTIRNLTLRTSNITVMGNASFENVTVVLNGNLTVDGKVNATRSTFLLNGTNDGDLGINVTANGMLNVTNASNITNGDTSAANYFFLANPGANFTLTDSEVSYAGWTNSFAKRGLEVNTSRVVVNRTRILDGLYGLAIYENANHTVFDKVHINRSGSVGFYALGVHDVNITELNGTVTSNTNGINVVNASNITFHRVRAEATGLTGVAFVMTQTYAANVSYATLDTGSTISTGISCNCTDSTIADTNVSGYATGIATVSGNRVLLLRVNVTANTNGVTFTRSNNSVVVNSYVQLNTVRDFTMSTSGAHTLLNTTFNQSNWSLHQSGSANATVQWSVSVLVNQTNKNVAGSANVQLYSADLLTNFTNKTGSSGYIRYLNVTEYYQDASRQYAATNYTLNVSKETWANRSVSLNFSGPNETFATLSQGPEYGYLEINTSTDALIVDGRIDFDGTSTYSRTTSGTTVIAGLNPDPTINRFFLDFNISAIQDYLNITNVSLRLTHSFDNNRNHNVNALQQNSSSYADDASGNAALYADCGNDAYLSSTSVWNSAGNNAPTAAGLGSTARTTLEKNLSWNYFSLCVTDQNEADSSTFHSAEASTDSRDPALLVNFTLPNQTWNEGQNNTEPFSLNHTFFSNYTLNWSANGTSVIAVSFHTNGSVNFTIATANENWSGVEYVTFFAYDQFGGNTTSSTVKLTVNDDEACADPPPASGNWVINTSCAYSTVGKVVNGSLLIRQAANVTFVNSNLSVLNETEINGSLHFEDSHDNQSFWLNHNMTIRGRVNLTNATLHLNGSVDGAVGINVTGTGAFNVTQDSNLTNGLTAGYNYFIVVERGNFTMNGSTMRQAGWSNSYGKRGLEVNSTFRIENSTLSANYIGVQAYERANHSYIRNAWFNGSGDDAIRLYDTVNVNISNVNMTDNVGSGLYAQNTTSLLVEDVNSSGNVGYGIYILRILLGNVSRAKLNNNTLSGIFCQTTCTTSVFDAVEAVRNAADGGIFNGGSLSEVWRSNFSNNTARGVRLLSVENITFLDTVLLNNTDYDVMTQTSGRNYSFINSTYRAGNVSIAAGTTLIRRWYVSVNVSTPTGVPIQSATANLFGRLGKFNYTGSTNSSGLTVIFNLTEYTQNGSVTNDSNANFSTNYTINATNGGNSTSFSYNITDNVVLNATLGTTCDIPGSGDWYITTSCVFRNVSYVVPAKLLVSQAANVTFYNSNLSVLNETEINGSLHFEDSHDNQSFWLNGNMTVRGRVNLTNATLRINGTTDGSFGINVTGNGAFNITQDSNVTNGRTGAYNYFIVIEEGSNFTMNGSTMRQAGWSDNYTRRGLEINSSFWIENSTLSASHSGVTLHMLASNTSIRNTWINGSGGDGIQIWGVQDLNLTNVNITDSNRTGLNTSNTTRLWGADMNISGGASVGIQLFRPMYANFSNIQATNNTATGLIIYQTCYSSTFDGISAVRNNLDGIWITSPAWCEILNSNVSNNTGTSGSRGGLRLGGGSNLTVVNTVIQNNTAYGIITTVSGPTIYLLNATMHLNNHTVVAGTRLHRQWYVTVNVSNLLGNGISGATVKLLGRQGYYNYTATTGSNGLTVTFNVTEYTHNGTGFNESNVNYSTNYTVNATQSGNSSTLSFNITDNSQINLTLGSSNALPNVTYVNFTPAEPNRSTYLNCTFVFSDDDNTSVVANYSWYNGTKVSFNGTVTLSNNTLGEVNVTHNYTEYDENWTCSVAAWDRVNISAFSNSTTRQISNNVPPIPTPQQPTNDNSTLRRRLLNFTWSNVTDQENDTVHFTLNVSENTNCHSGGYNQSNISVPNYTTTSELCVYTQDGGSNRYNWTVLACDNWNCSVKSQSFNFSIQPYVDIFMIVGNISFGTMDPNTSNDTTDDSPPGFRFRNDGNVVSHFLNISSNDSLWTESSAGLGTEYMMIRANESSENCSFNVSGSQTAFINLTSTNRSIVNSFNYSDTCDTVDIDFNVTSPANESVGDKEAFVWFWYTEEPPS